MSQYALPVLFGLFVWWFGTGLVLYLVRIGGVRFHLMMGVATIILAASAWGLEIGSRIATVGGAYFAFTCAILVWCWLEITFLAGLITGPRKQVAPPGCSGWRRVVLAINTILYHEIALLVCAAGIVALTRDGVNQVGAATFLVLWTMRLSAKLNLFLGVPILNDEFLPKGLVHLKSFFRCKPVNLLFPVAVTASTIVTALLVAKAFNTPSAFETAAFLLLATLMALAVLEHWFMVVPFPVKAIWEWSVGSWTAVGTDISGGVSDAARAPDPLQRSAARTGDHGEARCAPDEGEDQAKTQSGERVHTLGGEHPAPADPVPTRGLARPALATIWRHP
jgi:putative photosynthetic complex assembly protein 2